MIRAKTGNAVILIAVPINNVKDKKEILAGAKFEYKNRDKPIPIKKGKNTPN